MAKSADHLHANGEKSELPLILFTLCAAASVGVALSALVVFVAELVMQGGFAPVRAGLSLRQGCFVLQTGVVQPVLAATALALASVGMLASIAHLAKPLRAPGALRNLAKSWLSREIFAVSAYWVACVAWLAACFASEALTLACCVLSCALGCAVLWSASRAYRVHGQPLWDGPETDLELWAAAFGAGVPLACAFAFKALSGVAMPLAEDAALSVAAAYDPTSAQPAAQPAGFSEALSSVSPYLMTDALQLALAVGLGAAFLLYWLSGRFRAHRMAAILGPTPRERAAAARLRELEGPRKLAMALAGAAFAVGLISLLAWMIAGFANVALPAISAVLGFIAFFIARARFYRMAMVMRHAVC